MANPTMQTKAACLLFLTMLVIAPMAEAGLTLTCGQVVATLLPCLGFLKNGGEVSASCCNAAQSLNKTAKTTPDRQLACACLKQAAKSFGIDYHNCDKLASKCGVDVGIHIGPNTDCSKVH